MTHPQTSQINYYEILGIDPSASVDEVRRAFHRFALQYHPDRLGTFPQDEQERRAQIYRKVSDGYRLLQEPKERSEYDRKLGVGTQTGPVGRKGLMHPKARQFYTTASQAYKKGDLAQAKMNLKFALQHDPDHEDILNLQLELQGK